AAELENRDITHGGDLVVCKTRPTMRPVSSSARVPGTEHALDLAQRRPDLDGWVGIGGAGVCLLVVARHAVRILEEVSGEHGHDALLPADHAVAQELARALPQAAVLPRLPAGSTIQSGAAQSSCCNSSSMIVFCPSMRNGLIELSRYSPSRTRACSARSRHASKLPRTSSVRAP